MATLGLKEMGKFLWDGREKVLPSWLYQSSFDGKMQKKSGIMKSGLDAMPLFLLDDLLRTSIVGCTFRPLLQGIFHWNRPININIWIFHNVKISRNGFDQF